MKIPKEIVAAVCGTAFICGVFAIAGCEVSPSQPSSTRVGNIGGLGGISVFEDKNRGVTCWIVRDPNGIGLSCLKNEK
jgi:hypothetical protein